MYELAIERLTAAGYEHYEVSNFAKSGFRSRHNLVYWRNEEYLGFGPGAVSYIHGRRWTNEKNPTIYSVKVSAGSDLAVESETLPAEAAMAESLIQFLRLNEDVELDRLQVHFGLDSTKFFLSMVE